MMPRIWNGQDLDKVTPELGFRLELASLIPQFAAELLESGLVTDIDQIYLSPLDDFKGWLRTQNPGEEGLKHDVRALLLDAEEAARAAAAKAGQRFDLADYELNQMEGDSSYELFTVEWTKAILELVVEEADALQRYAKAENGENFYINLSFNLPAPSKNAALGRTAIEESLRKFGIPDPALKALLTGKGKRVESTGMLMLELFPRGEVKIPRAVGNTRFVNVGLVAPKIGDDTDAGLFFGYPVELEGYFLASFDALRQKLTLQGAKAPWDE